MSKPESVVKPDHTTHGLSHAVDFRLRVMVAGRILLGFIALFGAWVGYKAHTEHAVSGENLAIFGILIAFYAAFYAQSQFELSCWSMMQLEESRIDGDLRLLATKDVALEIQKATTAQYTVANTTLEALRTVLEVLVATREAILAQRAPVSFNFSLFGSNGGNSVAYTEAHDEHNDADDQAD